MGESVDAAPEHRNKTLHAFSALEEHAESDDVEHSGADAGAAQLPREPQGRKVQKRRSLAQEHRGSKAHASSRIYHTDLPTTFAAVPRTFAPMVNANTAMPPQSTCMKHKCALDVLRW